MVLVFSLLHQGNTSPVFKSEIMIITLLDILLLFLLQQLVGFLTLTLTHSVWRDLLKQLILYFFLGVSLIDYIEWGVICVQVKAAERLKATDPNSRNCRQKNQAWD